MGQNVVDSGDKPVDMGLLVYHILYERMYLTVSKRIEFHYERMGAVGKRRTGLVYDRTVRRIDTAIPARPTMPDMFEAPDLYDPAEGRIGGGVPADGIRVWLYGGE